MARPLLVLMTLSLWICGCASNPALIRDAGRLDVPQAMHVDDVPFFKQTAHQCGPAAMAMVLQWSGVAITVDELIPQLYTPDRKGSLQSSLIAGARRQGRLAYEIQGRDCLLQEVAAGHPVVVLQNLGIKWMPSWHYAVVVGYDLNQAVVELHSGRHPGRTVGFRTFGHTWRRADDWGLLVLPPGRMPACAEETTYLKAASGLAQAGAVEAAITALQASAIRWPQSPQVQVALGNAYYDDGRLEKAVAVFQRACELDAQYAPAFNNLAHTLGQLGRWDAAETVARRAIALGGTYLKLYRRTLEEILQHKR